jgi:hypothetical protein
MGLALAQARFRTVEKVPRAVLRTVGSALEDRTGFVIANL